MEDIWPVWQAASEIPDNSPRLIDAKETGITLAEHYHFEQVNADRVVALAQEIPVNPHAVKKPSPPICKQMNINKTGHT
jgi:hypothetical protein